MDQEVQDVQHNSQIKVLGRASRFSRIEDNTKPEIKKKLSMSLRQKRDRKLESLEMHQPPLPVGSQMGLMSPS